MLGKFLSRRFLNNPIFLVGGSRSGTSALRKALGKHPLILSVPGEGPFFADLGRLSHDLAFASERELQYYADSLRITREYLFQDLARIALESALGPDYGIRYLIKASFREKVNLTAKRHFCVKTTPGEHAAKGLQALYPGARFIWVVRNGIEVVHSRTLYADFRALEFVDQCRHWANSIQRFAYLNTLREAITVRHEDFVNEPEQVFRRIFEHIGVPYHPVPTEYAQHTLVHPLADKTVSVIDVRQALSQRASPYETWNEMQRTTFKETCGHAMALTGYAMPSQ
jgi:hypothetical protein